MTPETQATEASPTVHACKTCGARIYWARSPETSKAMPVDAAPTERGTVELFRRAGSRAVYFRVLNRQEADAHTGRAIEEGRGPRLRTSHFATCRQASKHRRGRS